jgi:hypothetical protein
MTLSDPTATPAQRAATVYRRLLVFEEGAGDPVELPCRRPVAPAPCGRSLDARGFGGGARLAGPEHVLVPHIRVALLVRVNEVDAILQGGVAHGARLASRLELEHAPGPQRVHGLERLRRGGGRSTGATPSLSVPLSRTRPWGSTRTEPDPSAKS